MVQHERIRRRHPYTTHSIPSTPPSISPIFVRTYTTLINVLTVRDDEVYWLIEAISKRIDGHRPFIIISLYQPGQLLKSPLEYATTAGHTIRNVLSFQTGTNPSSTSSLASWNNSTGSSSWGNGHAGAGGGAKFHPGSRFYSGYKQPSRSVAQANTSSTDTGVTYQDDTDESRPTRPQTVTQSTRVARKQRSRSQSFSLGSDAIATAERAKSFGVLQVVQQHARLHHAFVGSYRPQRVLEDAETASRPPTPRLVRRNSTTSMVSVSSLHDDISLSSRPAPSIDPTDSAQPQSVLVPEPSPTDSRILDPFEVRAELLTLRQPNYESTVDNWNDVLDKLAAVRKHNEQPTEILQTYNDMVTRSIQPKVQTYMTLINVLTARDDEVHWLIETLSKHIEKRHALGLYNDDENFVDQRHLEALRGEQNFPSALRFFSAASANRKYFLQASVYIALLQSCARHQNVKEAIRLFTHLERRGFPKPSASIYAHLLDVYMSVSDIEGARVVFDEFRKVCSQGKIHDWPTLTGAKLVVLAVANNRTFQSTSCLAAFVPTWHGLNQLSTIYNSSAEA
ncbi:hypothetical protein F5888DRAFT_1825698 [Russula emetica]|nr:hypothetical protein F5888DRAFT_1825698 [Russula emetica]